MCISHFESEDDAGAPIAAASALLVAARPGRLRARAACRELGRLGRRRPGGPMTRRARLGTAGDAELERREEGGGG
jgi:hypothetical protein